MGEGLAVEVQGIQQNSNFDPEEERADSPACHAGDSGGSTHQDRQKTPKGIDGSRV